MDKSQIADALRSVAINVNEISFTCWVVGRIIDSNAMDTYVALFSPCENQLSVTWVLSDHSAFNFTHRPNCERARQKWRATALCFVAAMVEAGDFHL